MSGEYREAKRRTTRGPWPMSGSATVTTQLGSSSFSASVRARAAARWPPPVSLKRIRILGEPPAGMGESGGAGGGGSSGGAARDPAHVVLSEEERDEDHRGDPDADPEDRSLGELARRQWRAALDAVLLDDVGGQVPDVLIGEVDVAALGRHLGRPRVARLRLAPVGDDADQEGLVQRV